MDKKLTASQGPDKKVAQVLSRSVARSLELLLLVVVLVSWQKAGAKILFLTMMFDEDASVRALAEEEAPSYKLLYLRRSKAMEQRCLEREAERQTKT